VRAAYRLYPQVLGEPSPVIPEGMPVREEILGAWYLTVELPQMGRTMEMPFTIALNEKGRAFGRIFEEDYEDGEVVATDFGVFFAATLDGKGGEGHLSASLKQGKLTGTVWLPGEHLLMAFVGERPEDEAR